MGGAADRRFRLTSKTTTGLPRAIGLIEQEKMNEYETATASPL